MGQIKSGHGGRVDLLSVAHGREDLALCGPKWMGQIQSWGAEHGDDVSMDRVDCGYATQGRV